VAFRTRDCLPLATHVYAKENTRGETRLPTALEWGM
jgi:hypothetical protein